METLNKSIAGLRNGSPVLRLGICNLEPITKRFLSYFTILPSYDLIILINKFIRTLIVSGIYNKLDSFYFMNLNTQEASILNLIDCRNYLTLNGSVSFIKGYGMYSDGSSGSLISNSRGMFKNRINFNTSNCCYGMSIVTESNVTISYYFFESLVNQFYRQNNLNIFFLTAASGNSVSFNKISYPLTGKNIIVSRLTNSSFQVYYNKTLMGSGGLADNVNASNSYLLGKSGGITDSTISMYYNGGGLTLNEVNILSDAIDDFKNNVFKYV